MTYEELLEKIESGHHWSINFETRTFKFGKKVVDLPEFAIAQKEEVLENLQKLFDNYFYSTPSERSSYDRHFYFKAMDVDDMTTQQMINGSNREVARFELELFMLSVICNYKWEDLFDDKHFFWKGKNGLIVLKEWFNGIQE